MVGILLAGLSAGCAIVGSGSTVASSPGFEGWADAEGQRLLRYKRDVEVLTRRAGEMMSDAEVHAIEVRPLPPTRGLAFDLALLTRALAQATRHDHQGLDRTRDLALRRGTDRDLILGVLSLHASALRTAGLSKSARLAYADAERFMLETARRTGRPVHRSLSEGSFVLDYLFAAAHFGDAPLGDRIASRYLEPLLTDNTIDPAVRLIARLYLFDYRVTMQTAWGGGDPLAGYHELDGLISRHQVEVGRMVGAYAPVARNKMMDLRIKAGDLALLAGRPSLAAAQLRAVEAEVSDEMAKRFAIDELKVSIALSSHQYELALATLDATRQRLPELIKGLRVVRVRHQIGRANVLASLGRWEEAERELQGVQIDASYLALLDHFTGLRSVVRAVLGREDPDLGAFLAMDPKYRDGSQGIDRSVLYFAAKTVIFQQRAIRASSQQDAMKAVDGGRQMSRFLRLRQAAGLADRSGMAPLFLDLAKEAYVLSALRMQGTPGVSMDDVLDAAQLHQTADIDQDIAAAAQRLRASPGIESDELRQLQNLQRRVAAAQAELGSLLSTVDADPHEIQRSVDQANAASAELDRRLMRLVQAKPGLRYAFGGVDAVSVREIQGRLAPGEALLTVVPMSASTLVFFASRTDARLHLAPAGRRDVSALVDRIHRTTALTPSARLLDFDVDASRQIHRMLLGWQPNILRGVNSMTVAATGSLAALPFGLLVRDTEQRVAAADYRRQPWLIRSVALAHVPSISSWLALTGPKAPTKTDGFIAWASPDFTGQAPREGSRLRNVRAPLRLPSRPPLDAANVTDNSRLDWLRSLDPIAEGREEALAIARALGATVDTDVLLGSAATRRSVIERSTSGDLARRSVVLFATHGLAPFQIPGLDQPALVMAHDPAEPASTLLTLDDVLGLHLNADWVILSACNTGSADRDEGDALSGLSRGFFFAGARGMLVTHWAVDSKSAAEITTRTVAAYAASATISRAHALQRASLALIDGRGTSALWSHPAYWAPYALVGDGRRRPQIQ